MNNKKITYKIMAILLCLSMLTACGTGESSTRTEGNSSETASSANDGESIPSSSVNYDIDDFYMEWSNDNPSYIELKGSSMEIKGSGAVNNENILKITKSGVYVLSGKLDDGQILVDTEDKDSVRLVLKGAEINCSDGPAINISNAEKVVISLEEGTVNTVSDGSSYNLGGEDSDEPNSSIFSKEDLTINGTGTLNVKGNYNNGITGRDSLKITGGNIYINAVDDGIMGRDLVAIKDGSIKIDAGGKGIKTTNDTDPEAGAVYIEGGVLEINSTDDAMNSVNGINISAGEITIETGDDGMHSDSFIRISGGTVNIKKSAEGIEAEEITIDDGKIYIVSSDDGINAAGGNNEQSANEQPVNEKPGANNFVVGSDYKITINGGTVLINASGDGIDANGSIYMNGGEVTVNGPTSDGNGYIDYDREFVIKGGMLAALGSSGMAQMPSDSSSQPSVMVNFTQTQKSGIPVVLKDSTGNTVLEVQPEKEYRSIVMSSSDLKVNDSYSLYVGDTKILDFTLSKTSLRISDTGQEITGGMNRPNGFGGGRGGNMTPPDGEQGVTSPDGGQGMTPPQEGSFKGPRNGERPSMPGSTDDTTDSAAEN